MFENIDFDKARELASFTTLIHGAFGAGKTHLLGDFLVEESLQGPVAFINMRGEDGYLSIADLRSRLGDNLVVAGTANEFNDLVDNPTNPTKGILVDIKAAKCRAIGIDGLQNIYPFAYRKKFGADRLPEIKQGASGNEWGEVHKLVSDLIESLRRYAPMIMCTSRTDRSMDQLTSTVSNTPDFPGRMAVGIAGKFDFVFYLDYKVMGENKIQRTLQTAPVEKMVVRSRLPKPLPASIKLNEGSGSWKKIVDEIRKAVQKDDK